MRRADRVEYREGLVLEDLILGHRLHDEVRRFQVLEVGRPGDACERRVLGLRVELALHHEALERLAQSRERAPNQLVVGLDEQDLEAGLGRDLDDAGAHEPAPDDADVRDGHAMPRFARDRRDGGMSSGYFRARPGSGGGS